MEGEYFKDEDFVPKKKDKKDQKKTLKDVIREDAMRKIRDDESAHGSSDEEHIFKKSRKQGET